MAKLIFIYLSMFFLIYYFKKKYYFLIFNLIFLTIYYFLLNNFFKNYFWLKINYIMGMDYLSYILILLSLWVLNLSLISNLNFLMINYNKYFFFIIIVLLLTLVLTFSMMNLMFFYIFFEISLIPMLFLIMGWGYQIDRIQASMYMIFYTLFGSFPLLFMIFYIFMSYDSLMMNILIMYNLNLNNFFLFMMINMAFFIKMPMFLVHLWLPKAHVEAPVSGSMILAGIMLKLGTYGFYRFMIMFKNLYLTFNLMFLIISLIGSLIASLICLNQNDMKVIVAYSSVVHMSILMSSMLTLFNFSFKGSVMLMVAHGLCSSGMFYIINLNYERLMSRSIFINKNLINIMPILTMWWFLLCSSNFSAPPSLNLFSEIFLFISLIQWNKLLFYIIILVIFFSSCYSIFLYSFSQYGKINMNFFSFKLVSCRENLILFMHWFPLNLIFLNLDFLIYFNQ